MRNMHIYNMLRVVSSSSRLCPVLSYIYASPSHLHLRILGIHKRQLDRLHTPLRKHPLHILIHIVRATLCIHPDDLALFFHLVDNRHARLDKYAEPLLDALHVVVCAARRLAALKQALFHDGFAAVEEEGEGGGDNGALEGVGLVEFAREACASTSVFHLVK